MTTHDGGRRGVEPAELMCVLCAQTEDRERVPDAKLWTFYTVEFGFGFVQIVTGTLFSLLE